MAKAEAANGGGGAPEVIRNAGEVMMLLITASTWETLLRQGAAEGLGPGQVLDKALRFYLEAHGSKEAVEYLHAVAEEKGR